MLKECLVKRVELILGWLASMFKCYLAKIKERMIPLYQYKLHTNIINNTSSNTIILNIINKCSSNIVSNKLRPTHMTQLQCSLMISPSSFLNNSSFNNSNNSSNKTNNIHHNNTISNQANIVSNIKGNCTSRMGFRFNRVQIKKILLVMELNKI